MSEQNTTKNTTQPRKWGAVLVMNLASMALAIVSIIYYLSNQELQQMAGESAKTTTLVIDTPTLILAAFAWYFAREAWRTAQGK